MYENDPRRTRLGEPGETMIAPRWALGGLIVAALVALALAFWPAGETGTTVTDTSKRNQQLPATSPTAPTPPNNPQR